MFENEYRPLIENNCFYLLFKDYKGSLHKVEVTKDVFLQFFGVHKRKYVGKEEVFLICYHDTKHYVEKSLNKQEYQTFTSFKSDEMKLQHIYTRHIEHFDLTDEQLYKRHDGISKYSVLDKIYDDYVKQQLFDAIYSLSKTQRERLILYYINEYTMAEIAEKESCSISAVKHSIDRALSNLKEKLKNLY